MEAIRHVMRAQADGDAVRTRILDAAQELFASAGYAGATTREIAARAGIGKRMLFYYFPSKDAVYRAVLVRTITGMVAVHEQFRGLPGPVGLANAIEGMTQLAATNLPALRVWLREIMDGGRHLEELATEYLRPLFEKSSQEVARNMAAGRFRTGDPMHVLVNVGGITLFYFMIVPLLRQLWRPDPLAPATLAERAAAARDFVMHGLAAAGQEGAPS